MKTTSSLPTASELLFKADASLSACSADSARTMLQAAHTAGGKTYRIDLGTATDTTKLHHVLARALHFPDWYGHNWDALADCLSDMSWDEANTYVLALQRAEPLQTADPESFNTLVEILEDAVQVWHEQKIRFWVLLIGDFPELPRLEVNA
ncbi:barstar family protein [Uliginosibacterium sp. 31-12]|uniref:barstar family protein n=1 Tax=Uliginosibacterium sp. 31-12 TaxID=3062781 RepID=UPI0026E44DA1|nr:barstar family protein [Uliginosibacterium sp. 31-12]MDO6385012.1 barstar family protein [Uliginosibacterium sp. 31-12]